MKLQFKLALYNTLTKVAIILIAGLMILISIETIAYHHIEVRLENAKDEIMVNLSSKEINSYLVNQKVYEDFTILKEEYFIITPIPYKTDLPKKARFKTQERALDKSREIYRVLTYEFNFNNHTYELEVGETIEAIEELKTIIKQFTLVVLGLALSLTLVSDLIFTRYLLSPFYRIIDRKLIKVNDPMNFDYEKVHTSTQDFTLLDDSISSLMKKISSLFLLEKQFIANVSHELLTPISIISSRLENVMLQEERLSVESENKLFASLKTLNRLKSIINSLLLISKVENNQFNKADAVSIHEVIGEIAEELEDRLEDKKINWVNKIKYHFSFLGNRPLIHTLLFNIINNAIKYNHSGGSITIQDHAVDDLYIMEIIDTGIGMDTEQIEKAFNRFEKLDSDELDSYGLGLAIVKSIAAFHSINVTIESAKDKGTTFLLTFKSKLQLH